MQSRWLVSERKRERERETENIPPTPMFSALLQGEESYCEVTPRVDALYGIWLEGWIGGGHFAPIFDSTYPPPNRTYYFWGFAD